MMLIKIIDCENVALLSMLVLFCLDSDMMKKIVEKILLLLWSMLKMMMMMKIDFHWRLEKRLHVYVMNEEEIAKSGHLEEYCTAIAVDLEWRQFF